MLATRLSCLDAVVSAHTLGFRVLARLSLVLFAAGMTPACVIDDPPPYVPPKKTAPRLDLLQASPPIGQVIVRTASEINPAPLNFTVSVASEDAGEDLTAFLLLDYQGPNELKLDDATIRPGTLDEPPRTIELDWTIQSNVKGCNSLTMVVSHSSNFRITDIADGIDKSDVSIAPWWLYVMPDPGSNDLPTSCPPITAAGL